MSPSIKSKLSSIAIAAHLLAISSSLCAGVLGWILVIGDFHERNSKKLSTNLIQ